MEGETNVFKILNTILGTGVARQYLAMCQPDKQEAFLSLTVDQIGLTPLSLKLNGSLIYGNFVFFSNIPESVITLQYNTNNTNNTKKEDVSKTLSLKPSEDIMDMKDIIIKKGIVVLPSHFFLGDKVGGKKKVKRTLTPTAYRVTHKLRSYRVFQGKRGGLYIKVKGEWKPLRKDSQTSVMINEGIKSSN